ncbi:LLM class flavin-dependent oxidoreductase [Frankia sp. QA3]|uniref:LLM class flavin-dependent oxidoreductase n=1 Tax=Frankia sp. QA3 TaxID=710111 RepID=UPI000269C254|nr:LLM class flavin-dependent oxidoreductase [Frankia sp. QA3]EIV92815.1 flavin-dependent oxidoreductase, F420-dependent methylene-tetrahydromethanopterin reductase [Frankia sp. QA3]
MTTDSVEDRPFKLGFLTHVHGPGRPARAVYRDLVEFFVAAEELGFDGGWVAQHHLRADYGRLPSPLVLLAAVAERTSRIELGTGIVVVPLEDPLRLAEDAAVLDELSGGRVQLGLGSGGANLDSFTAFGRDPQGARPAFEAAVRTVGGALRGGTLGGGSLTLQPPASGLADRLWHATSTAEGARFAAASGNGLLLGSAVHDPRGVQLPLAESYLDAWPADSGDAHELGDGSGARPRIAVIRAVFPAKDRRDARDDLAPAIELLLQVFARHGVSDVDELTVDDGLARLNVHYGHPDEVIGSLRADPALLDFVDYFVPVVSHEVSTLDADIRRLETIAREIAPALGWRPAAAATAGTGTGVQAGTGAGVGTGAGTVTG